MIKRSALMAGLTMAMWVGLSAPALADAVLDTAGRTLRGEVVEAGTLVFVTDATGHTHRLERAQVLEIQRADARPPTPAALTQSLHIDRAVTLVPGRVDAPEALVAAARDVVLVGGGAADDPFSFETGLALSLSQGNSDILDIRADALARFERDPWAMEAGIVFVYGETDGDQSAESINAHLRAERKLNARLYVFGEVLYDRDKFADLEHRITPTLGLGLVIAESAMAKLTGEIGGGYTFEKRFSRGTWTRDPSGYLGLDYEFEHPTTGSKLVLAYDFFPNFDDFDLSRMVFDSRLDLPIGERIDFSLGLRVNHVLEPPSGVDSADLLFTAGIRVRW